MDNSSAPSSGNFDPSETQDGPFGSPRIIWVRNAGYTFGKADLILSVSHFNTRQLVEAFPGCEGRVAHVPNAAEDLFFEPASPREPRRSGPTWRCLPEFPISYPWRIFSLARTSPD